MSSLLNLGSMGRNSNYLAPPGPPQADDRLGCWTWDAAPTQVSALVGVGLQAQWWQK